MKKQYSPPVLTVKTRYTGEVNVEVNEAGTHYQGKVYAKGQDEPGWKRSVIYAGPPRDEYDDAKEDVRRWLDDRDYIDTFTHPVALFPPQDD